MTARRSSSRSLAGTALAASPVPLCRLRLHDGRVLEANTDFRALCGDGDDLAPVLGPDWLDQFVDVNRDGLREALLTDVDGRRLQARLRRTSDGEALLALTVASADPRSDDLHQVIDTLAEALWEWDLRDGGARFLGQGVHSAGFSLETIPSRSGTWADLIHEADRDRFHHALEDHLAGQSDRFRVEYRMRQADGAFRWVLGRGVVVERDGDGRPVRMMGLITDIEDRRQREDERTRLEAQLRHVQKLDALGQLTGGIAHDFNNILASVLGYAELGLLEAGPERLTEYFNEIVRAAERGRELIAKLLLFSRAGQEAIRPEATSSLSMVTDTLRMLRPMLPATLDLQVDVAPALPAVQMDPSELQQLVLNLAINARDAVGENGRIEVRLQRGEPAGSMCASCGAMVEACDEWVELVVVDDGVGMTEETSQRIFDPFFSTKEAGRGSGLGLSMVHGIAHEHGGHVLLDSDPGSGSRFTVLMRPALDASDTVSTEAAEPVWIDGRGERVLVVDDEPAIGAWMATLLGRHGFDVEVHHDSDTALDHFELEPDTWSLVITDQSMPGLSGVELADELLALRPGLPILICSGFSEFVDAGNARELGFRGFLQKPVNARDLLAAVGRCLGRPGED